jgi:hypothetical protein
MQLRSVNFPVEDGHLLMQREILRQERCSGHDQAPDEPKRAEMRTINVEQIMGVNNPFALDNKGCTFY